MTVRVFEIGLVSASRDLVDLLVEVFDLEEMSPIEVTPEMIRLLPAACAPPAGLWDRSAVVGVSVWSWHSSADHFRRGRRAGRQDLTTMESNRSSDFSIALRVCPAPA
jgi:hypothetical protein